ncbi:hypothetical protein Celaphus_00000496, partial [Cervus elaphus hippelaphus]
RPEAVKTGRRGRVHARRPERAERPRVRGGVTQAAGRYRADDGVPGETVVAVFGPQKDGESQEPREPWRWESRPAGQQASAKRPLRPGMETRSSRSSDSTPFAACVDWGLQPCKRSLSRVCCCNLGVRKDTAPV